MKLSHTKVFCTAFKCLQFGFVIFWRKDFGAKAAHKMLVKLTPEQNFQKHAVNACTNKIVLKHRFRKSKIDCLRFVMCPLLEPVFQGFFFCGGH